MATAIGHFERIRALAGNARLLVTAGVRASVGSEVVLFDHTTNKLGSFFEAPSHVLGLAASKDVVLAACADGAVRALQFSDGKLARTIERAHAGACTAVAIGPD